MEISYTVYDPTKNITALVTSPVPRDRHAAIAAELMRQTPAVEQVGYLEPSSVPSARLRLQMMGGEFCGNATMSAAAYLAQQDGLPAGQAADVLLEVSGASGVLSCHIENCGDHFLGTVAMPLPLRIGTTVLSPDCRMDVCPAVWFPGIVHCIVPAARLSRQQSELLIRPLCKRLKADACGILLYSEDESSFSPLVYVASTDTAVWESGCGSGTAALGSYLAAQSQQAGTFSLHQPGGVISVFAAWNGHAVSALSITGKVRRIGAGLTAGLTEFSF